MTNEKPTNPSHGELLDDLITLVMIRVGERKQVNEGRVAELRSLILGKMGEGEKLSRTYQALREIGEMAVVDWQDKLVGLVTAALKDDAEQLDYWSSAKQWKKQAERLQSELAQWKTWGIVEIAVRNPEVAEYCEHREGRATKAESELEEARKELVAANEAADKNSGLIDKWKDRAESLLGDGETWDDAEKAIAARLAAQEEIHATLESVHEHARQLQARLAAQPDLAEALRNVVDAAHRMLMEMQNAANSPRIEYWNEQIVGIAHSALESISAHLAPQAGVPQNKELSDLLFDYRKQIVREVAGQPCAPSEVRAEILARFAPASHTPRCPKCGSDKLEMHYLDTYAQMRCTKCGAQYDCEFPADFARFFGNS